MKTVYILRGQDRLGPFQPADVQKLLNTGQLHRDEPAWTEGAPDWEPLQVVLPRALAAPGDPMLRDLVRKPGASALKKKRRSFLADLPDAFLYPFRGHGPYLLVSGAVALFLCGLFLPIAGLNSAHIGYIPLFTFLFIVSYYAGCLLQIIRASASGDDSLIDAPDIAAVHDELSGPLLQILGTIAGCLAPAAAAWYAAREGWIQADWAWVVPVLTAAGLAYLPMALLASTILGSVLIGLNPLVVIPAIFRSLARYAVVLIFLSATVLGGFWMGEWLNQRLTFPAAAAAITLAVLYLGFVQARLIGLLFKSSPNRLGWFG